MSLRTRISTLIICFTGLMACQSAFAQLRGTWHDEVHWRDSDNVVLTHTARMSARASNTGYGVPRGDLRKDVSDASHGAPRSRPR